jgi:uncharacterized damage-inducible protein DinB
MEIRTMDGFLDYYGSIRARTRRVVAAIPDERMEWRPGEGRMTFGDQIRHLASFERWVFVENAAGRPSRAVGWGRELADGADAVRRYLDDTHAESVAILRSLGDAALDRRTATPAGTPITVWKWLRAMVEHEAHHRGQLYLMLGMLGVHTPPLYGLTEEEVRARSHVG